MRDTDSFTKPNLDDLSLATVTVRARPTEVQMMRSEQWGYNEHVDLAGWNRRQRQRN